MLEAVGPIAVEREPAASLPQVGLGIGFLAPAFSTVTVEGAPIALDEVRGNVTVLNFWATWCGPCRVEMPHLQAAYEQYAEDGLQILAINRGEPVERVAAFKDEFGLTFPVLLDQSDAITGADYQVFSMPTTFVLDEDGVILFRHFGALSAAKLDEMLVDALDHFG